MKHNHFDERYGERARLQDGTQVFLRLVGPEDKALIRRGFERLSSESRYRRFFAWKRELSDAELRYFTELDGENHLAIGASRTLPDGTEDGLGVARFIRIPGEPTIAEAAIAVVDDFQGRGLGRLLLLRLVAAARERGVERFRISALADNPAALALLREAADVESVDRGQGTVSVDVVLPDVAVGGEEPPHASALYRLFRAAARDLASVLGFRAGSG